MFLSLGASRGVWNPVERPFVPVPRSPKRRRRAGGTCFGVALPGIRRSARVFACSGRDPLCDPGSSGRAAVCAVFPVMCGSAWAGAANWGPGSMTCTLPVTSSWSISSRFRSKQGFACIPYPEIGRKILSLKSRMQTVRDTAGEQSRQGTRRQAGAEKDSERPSRLLLQPRRGPGRPGLHRYGGAFPGEGGAAGSAPTPGGRLWRAPVLCGDVWRHSGDGHWRCPAGPGICCFRLPLADRSAASRDRPERKTKDFSRNDRMI